MAEPGPRRPSRFDPQAPPPLPVVDAEDADKASTTYSYYRTGLSRHRTELSEHRTDLSEYRTDLSDERTELSMRRTGLSFQRTRLSADRTLMSVIRTSLSLIGFGFTIAQAFQKLHDAGAIHNAAMPRNFGVGLIGFGVFMLIGGLVQEARFSIELARERRTMTQAHKIFGESRFPLSVSVITAVGLVLLGLLAAIAILFDTPLLG